MMDLRRLFRRGPGRRRLPAAYADALARIAELEERLAPVAGLVRFPCPMLGHPPLWSAQSPGDCPWCVAEAEADIAADLLAEVVPYRTAAANAEAVHVDAVADVPGSCFAEPIVVKADTEPRIIPDAPPGPPNSEAASVTERTQAVDVRELRERMGLGETMQIPVIPGAEDDTRPIAAVRPLAEATTH